MKNHQTLKLKIPEFFQKQIKPFFHIFCGILQNLGIFSLNG